MGGIRDSPSSHDVTVPTEHLRQATDDDIGIGQYLDIDESSDRLVDDDQESKLVREHPQLLQRRCTQERIRGEFAEEGEDGGGGGFEEGAEGWDVGGESSSEELTPWSPLLQDLERVGIGESVSYRQQGVREGRGESTYPKQTLSPTTRPSLSHAAIASW